MATFTMSSPHFLVIYLLYCILQGSFSEDGQCGHSCCSNFGEQEGKCVECIGAWGRNCSRPCEVNYYGPACRHRCYCQGDQICDHVYGCCTITDQTCQQGDAYANSQNIVTKKEVRGDQGHVTEKELHDNQGYTIEADGNEESSPETLTWVFISVSAVILVVGCLVSVCTWIRQRRLTRKAKPQSAKALEEYSITECDVKESYYDEIREYQMHGEYSITVRDVNESCKDDIQESQMNMDEIQL